jgi:hypothetical protein
VFNYVDKPDLTTRELVDHVGEVLGRRVPTVRVPYWLGMLGGYCFDVLGKVLGRKMAISSVRVRKFCAVTQFEGLKVGELGFRAGVSLGEGLGRTLGGEFLEKKEL